MRNGKKFITGCLAMGAIIMLAVSAVQGDKGAALAAPGTPRAEFDHVKYSWQTAMAGEKVKHTFNVRNTGTAELIIEQVKTS